MTTLPNSKNPLTPMMLQTAFRIPISGPNSTNKFPKPFVEWPTKNIPKQVTHTNLGFATHSFVFVHLFKKRQGHGALEESSLCGIMALDLYHFTGAQGDRQVAMRTTSGEMGWKMVMGGGCWWFLLLHLFCFPNRRKKGLFKTKTKEGTHINKLNKKGRNFQSSDFCFVPRKQWQNFIREMGRGALNAMPWVRGSGVPFSFQLKGEVGKQEDEMIFGSFCFNWRRSVDEPGIIFFVGFLNNIPGKKGRKTLCFSVNFNWLIIIIFMVFQYQSPSNSASHVGGYLLLKAVQQGAVSKLRIRCLSSINAWTSLKTWWQIWSLINNQNHQICANSANLWPFFGMVEVHGDPNLKGC